MVVREECFGFGHHRDGGWTNREVNDTPFFRNNRNIDLLLVPRVRERKGIEGGGMVE